MTENDGKKLEYYSTDSFEQLLQDATNYLLQLEERKANPVDRMRALVQRAESFHQEAASLISQNLPPEEINIIKREAWNHERKLFKKFAVPVAFSDQVPWVKESKGFDQPLYKEGSDGERRRAYRHSLVAALMGLGNRENSTNCLVESLFYVPMPDEHGPIVELLYVIPPADHSQEPFRMIRINAISRDPKGSIITRTYFEFGETNDSLIGRVGSWAKEIKGKLEQAGFPSESELPERINFEQAWTRFLEKANKLDFSDPLSYFKRS